MNRGSMFWGTIILLLGIVLLIGQFLPNVNVWGIFWPLVLIMLGVWFLVGRNWVSGEQRGMSAAPGAYPAAAGSSSNVTADQLNLPLADISEARIRFHHGAGRLDVNPSGTPATLLSGSFVGGVEQRLDRSSGSTALLDLRTRSDAIWAGWPYTAEHGGLSWNVVLTRDIPLQLEVETGASENHLNLQDLRVSELTFKTGASASYITLPANAGQSRVSVHSGAASVEISVPQGVAGRIHVQSGLAGIQVDPNHFPSTGSGYETPGYDSAANRVEIFVETGVGSVTIR